MNLIRRKLQAVRRTAQKGFTLIELAIVGIFLGLLAIFAITAFSGSATDTTRANSMFEATTKLADNWVLITQSCGISSDITATDLTGGTATGATAAANNLSVLLGTVQPSTARAGCVNTSGVRPLIGVSTGAAGAERIQGFTVTAENTTLQTRPAIGFTFGGTGNVVPDGLILPLLARYVDTAVTAVPATAATSDASSIRHSDSAARTLTIVKAL